MMVSAAERNSPRSTGMDLAGCGPMSFEEGGFREPTDVAWGFEGQFYISDAM